MTLLSYKVGVGFKCIGAWLLSTAMLLVYAETAPSIAAPDFTVAVACLVAGGLLFYAGCAGCVRRRDAAVKNVPQR